MSETIKPLMLDETGKAIVEALTQSKMTQTRIAEINAAADAAKSGIETKTDEQVARIPEVTALAEDVGSLKEDKADAIYEKTDRAKEHRINQTHGEINVIVYGKTTTTGTGDKSPNNPYTISGVNEPTALVYGKNMYDPESAVLGAPVFGADGVVATYNDIAVSYIKVTPGKTYAVSIRADTLMFVRITYLTEEKGFITRVTTLASNTPNSGSFIFTAPSNCHWIQLGMNQEGVSDFSKPYQLQFEVGDSVTEYDSYIDKMELAVTLQQDEAPLMGYAGIFDKVEFNALVEGERKLKLTKNWHTITLTGAENIGETSSGNVNQMFTIPVSKAPIRPNTNTIPIVCSDYNFEVWSSGPWLVDKSVSYYQDGLLRVKDSSFSTVEAFKNHLAERYESGIPVTISYVIDRPIVRTCDPLRVVQESSGQDLIFVSDNEIAVECGRDIKDYVLSEIAKAKEFGIDYGVPILYLIGDVSGMSKDNAVTLDYVYGDRYGKCTCKWQGSSSLSYIKKNYTVKFDTAFEAKDGWGEQKKYCFKANWIDASHARNVVSAKLWGQIVKSRSVVPEQLSTLINGGAVDGFPCVIVLNGKFHGLFTWNIPKDGWMYGMENGEREAIVCADNHVLATRFKGPATLDGDFEVEYVPDKNNTDWVKNSLNTMINACIASDGSDLDDTVAQYLDWPSAIDYYIFICLIRGDDCTDKNYLLTTFDGIKWRFGAYDMDSTWGLRWDGKSINDANKSWNNSIAGYADLHRAMYLIKNYKTDALKARYTELRASVLSEDNVATVFANFIGKIPTTLYNAERENWKSVPFTSVNDLHQIVDWYRRRVAVIDAEISAL